MQSLCPHCLPLVHYCISESQTRPEAASKSLLGCGGPHKLTYMNINVLCHHFTSNIFHSLIFSFFFLNTHTHSLNFQESDHFRKQLYVGVGHVSARLFARSNWMLDQYFVPCQPASSVQTDCLWNPVFVIPHAIENAWFVITHTLWYM